LAAVYGIIQQYEGAIHVYSEPNKGTTFKAYLPTVNVTASSGSIDHTTAAAGGTETILVAEDEAMVRDLVVRILEGAGYRVLAASDGEEALEVFEEHRGEISLLLLDAVMPKLSGHDVYAKIKSDGFQAKVVFCTGYDPETAQSSVLVEANLRLIQKPFDSRVLLRTVREVLDEVGPCQIRLAEMAG
jgi:CheY-like chemotaxis protein